MDTKPLLAAAEHDVASPSSSSVDVNIGDTNTTTPQTAADDGGEKWGLPLNELYRLGLGFFKDKSGKAVQLSYEDNLKLIAFTQQVAHGPLDTADAPPLGVFDVIGRNRRLAWQTLGALTRPQSQDGFVELLDRLCPSFKPYVEAIKQDRAEKLRQRADAERVASEQREYERRHASEQRAAEEQRSREEQQRRQLQDALNQQTYEQFRAYASKQYPGNPDEQALLIRQLQSEHYHQYMQQLQAQVVVDTLAVPTTTAATPVAATALTATSSGANEMHESAATSGASSSVPPSPPSAITERKHHELIDIGGCAGGEMSPVNADEEAAADARRYHAHQHYELQPNRCHHRGHDGTEGTDCCEYPNVRPARLWVKQHIDDFKQSVMLEAGDGVLHIPRGHSAVVRVPTREGGSCMYWEFATDTYDIGFGVFFEWGKAPSMEVTVTMDEESDEEEDDDDEASIIENDEEMGKLRNIPDEQLMEMAAAVIPSKLTTELVPCYRRESHKEVYAGSHEYPGDGTYLLKFDNCFSMWRSKTLYYRIFYTR